MTYLFYHWQMNMFIYALSLNRTSVYLEYSGFITSEIMFQIGAVVFLVIYYKQANKLILLFVVFLVLFETY